MKNKITIVCAGLCALLGLATIFAGGSVILDLFGMREKEGNYVLFVVWANFLCGFLYVFAAYGFYKLKKWTASILLISLILLIAAFAGLLTWIIAGFPFETKTVVAMSFRTILTLCLFLMAKKSGRMH